MDNKYISGFINSKDIQKYLQDIDYQFTVPEYAFLIWQNREISIQERHKAFEKLLETTESCLIKTTCCRDGWDLHRTISEYIALEDRIIQLFLKQEANCFYTGEWIEGGGDDWYGDGCLFADHNRAYSYATKNAEKRPVGLSFRVSKYYIDNAETKSFRIDAYYNSSGEMISIDFVGESPLSEYENELLFERFDDMWFDIPIPFKPGDIVCERYNKNPFVITTTIPWYRKEHPPKKNTGTLHLTNMDMTASGYFVDEEAIAVKYNWLGYYYLNLEYYTGELSGNKRILHAYSLFKKEKLNCDTLSKVVQMITAEGLAKKACQDIDWMFEDNTDILLGLEKYKEKKHE